VPSTVEKEAVTTRSLVPVSVARSTGAAAPAAFATALTTTLSSLIVTAT
jgi:hypothetical protein